MRRLLLCLGLVGLLAGGLGCRCGSRCDSSCHGGLLGGSHAHGVCDCDDTPWCGACAQGGHTHGSPYAPAGGAAAHGHAPAPLPPAPEQIPVLPKEKK